MEKEQVSLKEELEKRLALIDTLLQLDVDKGAEQLLKELTLELQPEHDTPQNRELLSQHFNKIIQRAGSYFHSFSYDRKKAWFGVLTGLAFGEMLDYSEPKREQQGEKKSNKRIGI